MNPKLVWPGVVLVAIGAAAATIMGIAHVDSAIIGMVIMALIVPVLAAMISAKQAETGAVVQQVKEQTNGNLSRMLDIIERWGAQLAVSTPAAAPAPAVEQPEQRV